MRCTTPAPRIDILYTPERQLCKVFTLFLIEYEELIAGRLEAVIYWLSRRVSIAAHNRG